LLGATLDLAESSLGPDDVRVAVVRENYAGALRAAGRHAEAEEQLDRAVAVRFALSRVDDPIVLEMLVDRADSLVELGRERSALGVLTVAEALGRRLRARDDLGAIREQEVEQQVARVIELRASIEN